MEETKKILVTGILLGILMIFSINMMGAVCCERTIDELGICLDVGDIQYCDTDYRTDDTACESTEYCSTGTCVNNAEGTCMTSSSSACDPALGGFWYEESYIENPGAIQECEMGCCFIGSGTSFIPRTTCNKMSAIAKVQLDFRDSITTQEECLLSSGPTTEGACVFQTEIGRECTIKTNEECTNLGREFHAGFLCSAPELGTICIMTEETRCEEGRNEVYFVDYCDNLANVYNSTLVNDVDYWTYMKDFASDEICGYGLANINSIGCGNCLYGDGGSTCGPARGTGVNPTYGDYICRDLSCTYNGETKAHGNAWCSQPISYFETAKPGDLSYRLYCYNGEVQWELCGNTRDYLCKEDVESEEANCLINRWQDCVFQGNSKDCLNTEKRDCRIEAGVSRKNESGDDILLLNYTYIYAEDGSIASESSESIKAVCVARYPPGFNFWDLDATILGNSPEIIPTQVCSAASVSSSAGYHKPLAVKWWAKEGKCFVKCIEKCDALVIGTPECRVACFEECPVSESFMDKPIKGEFGLGDVDLNADWATEMEGLCISLGDCGVKSNYIQQDSYYSWKDLFIGDNITKTSIPGADSYQ